MNRPLLLIFGLMLAVWTVGLLIPDPGGSAVGRVGGKSLVFYLAKTIHVGAYAVLTFVGGYAVATRPGAWAVLILLSAHAALTEGLQQFTGRGSSLRDVGLNHLGIVLGLAANWPRWRVLTRRGNPKAGRV